MINVLCPPSFHFDIIRTEQFQCFEGIWEVVHKKEKQEWTYHGAVWKQEWTYRGPHWSGPREFTPTRTTEARPIEYFSIQHMTTLARQKDFLFGHKKNMFIFVNVAVRNDVGRCVTFR